MDKGLKYKVLASRDAGDVVWSNDPTDDGHRTLVLVEEIDAPEDRFVRYVHLIQHRKTHVWDEGSRCHGYLGAGDIISSVPFHRGDTDLDRKQRDAVVAMMMDVFDTYAGGGIQPAFPDIQAERAARTGLKEGQETESNYGIPADDPDAFARYMSRPGAYQLQIDLDKQKADLYARWDAERKQRNGESEVTHKRTTIWNG